MFLNARNGPSYSGLSIADGIKTYAPGSDGNNVAAYIAAVLKASGLSGDTKLGDLNSSEMDSLLDAMREHEGFHEGTVDYVKRTP